jgi:hypothetical protein
MHQVFKPDIWAFAKHVSEAPIALKNSSPASGLIF